MSTAPSGTAAAAPAAHSAAGAAARSKHSINDLMTVSSPYVIFCCGDAVPRPWPADASQRLRRSGLYATRRGWIRPPCCAAAHPRFALHYLASRVWLTNGGQQSPAAAGRRVHGGRDSSPQLSAGRRDGGRCVIHAEWKPGNLERLLGCNGTILASLASRRTVTENRPYLQQPQLSGRCNKLHHCGALGDHALPLTASYPRRSRHFFSF